MSLMSIKMRPGINSQAPLLANEGGWSRSNLIRFKSGYPQAIGGWVKWWQQQLDSPARTILSWGDLNGAVRTAAGTDTSVYVIGQGSQQVITPLTVTTNPAPDFSTTNGSAIVAVLDNTIGQLSGAYVNIIVPVSVGGIVLQGIYQIISFPTVDSFTIRASTAATAQASDTGAVPNLASSSGTPTITVTLDNHGLSAGTAFGVPVATTVGGVTLLGSYLVQSVVDANTFTIDATSSATSTATASMNGGNPRLLYYGVSTSTGANYGFGVGGYGQGGYGQGVTYIPGALPTVSLWTMANWGETLILCAGDGSIFTWTPSTGQTEAQLILEAPPVNGGIFIAMPELTLVAWGASVNGLQEPLLVAWSTVGDYTQWIPTVTNQAGSQILPSGSRIMGAIQGPQEAMIWTDVDLYAMNYLGGSGDTALAWGFNKIADHCGLVGPRAVCVLDDIVFWLSASADMTDGGPPSGGTFMMFAGGVGVEPIPCSVWDEIFQDLDWAHASRIVAAPNALFHEVAWFYPSMSGGTGDCDRYVKFNFVEKTWDYGKLARCGWQDFSALGNPLAGGADGYLYQHEIGTSADGQPLDWSIGTSAVMLAQGNEMMFCDWILPEFDWGFVRDASTNQPVSMTCKSWKFVTDALPIRSQSVTFSYDGPGATTVRLRGRHMTFDFGGPGFARIGDVRIRVAPDGRY